MIGIKTNASDVKRVFREIGRLAPRVQGQVLSSVGVSLRKDVRTIIQGREALGVKVAKQADLTRQIKKYRGQKPTQGGKLINGVRYIKRRGSVSVATSGWARQYMTGYQRGESRPYNEREEYLVARATRPDLAAKHPAAVKGYVEKTSFGTKTVPARPLFGPLARSPELAKRIRDAAQKRIERMVKQQARKVRAA